MGTILKSGGLSLQELFARVGDQLSNRLRVANLLKSGEVRLETADSTSDTKEYLKVLEILQKKDNSSEDEIAEVFDKIVDKAAANSIAVVPTLKAWRNPVAAA